MSTANLINLNELSRKAKLILIALVAGIVIPLVSLTSSAYAYSCPTGLVCVYDGDDGSGTRYAFNGTQGVCTNVPGYANDKANSYTNMFLNTQGAPRHVSFYQDANCQGNILQLNDVPVGYTAEGTFPYHLTGPAKYRYDNRNKMTSFFVHTN